MQDLERRAASSEADLIGTVRVTCPETVGYRMMKTPLLDIFHERYPGLRIELLMVDRVLDLAKGEVDIAFRTAPPQDDALVSRKLATRYFFSGSQSCYLKAQISLEACLLL